MPKLAANLSLMYNEYAFLDRFAAAAADGFAGVEFLFPYDFTAAEAHAICREVGASNLKVQCDLYHCQILEGDLATTLRRDMAGIDHVQIAGVPQRHEPDLGEVNFPYLFALLDELGYAGWVGCEYRPRAGTSAGLGWLREWCSGKNAKSQATLA
ncbi:TIM barrel protein [Noviherbaspirillum sedimenti]|uniref:Xylose isomerase-like TIM barrel domain-containing protein n=1 Tax=Noviherbaspirillum sedimenti TaxID=2320865 RepID=A0A3A3FYG5_9BURK|nr:TIM barrel protein [Noviherbaspirillum sedimenti]RJG01223.1 hypothetical protein D3878_06185 [Noviherbaspirillum sedimenti]